MVTAVLRTVRGLKVPQVSRRVFPGREKTNTGAMLVVIPLTTAKSPTAEDILPAVGADTVSPRKLSAGCPQIP